MKDEVNSVEYEYPITKSSLLFSESVVAASASLTSRGLCAIKVTGIREDIVEHV